MCSSDLAAQGLEHLFGGDGHFVDPNAVYNAVGVRIDEVPITPEKVFKALRRKEKGEAGRFGPTAFPDIAWPEPTRVPPPWEGGDGRAVPLTPGASPGKTRSRNPRARARGQ